MRSILQSIVRLLLGAVLLPLIWCGFVIFSVVAVCSDKDWVHRAWMIAQRPTGSFFRRTAACETVAE